MLYEIFTLMAIVIVYKRLQLEPIGFMPRRKHLKLTAPKMLAHRNRYSSAQVARCIWELNEAIEHLVWLRNTPDVADSTFDSPFIFEDHSTFVIPITPEIGSPALDHGELYSTVVTHIKLLCFQLQVMGHDRDHAGVLTRSMSFEHLKVLLNTKETNECTRDLMRVLGQKNKKSHRPAASPR